jgi:xanthine dehydrogenase YagS FAD-binding subunit
MRPFKYVRASDPERGAAARGRGEPAGEVPGGRDNILDLMKEDVERPNELVD